jgi:hypothetical protein
MAFSEAAYFRVLRLVRHVREEDFGGCSERFLSSLSEANHKKIWNFISQDASRLSLEEIRQILQPKGICQEDNLRSNMAKRKLFAYVCKNGPFVFENDRCLLILASQFGWEDWQYMRVPVMDVTDCAQQAFLNKRKLQPEGFLSERYASWIFWIFTAALLLAIGFLTARGI